jgi:hypothetical protein
MIAVKLMGGLGNQMFQYAAGRKLALDTNSELFLDIEFLEAPSGGKYTQRHYELSQFKIKARPLDEQNRESLKSSGGILQKLGIRKSKVFIESGPAFNPGYNSLDGDVYLEGYWQSEKYFHSIREQLLVEFSPSYELEKKHSRFLEDIKNVIAVSVHVRRGDFVHLDSAKNFHGSPGMEYYQKAMDIHMQNYPAAVFYLFSDDESWCRENFGHKKNMQILSPSVRSSEDMLLMSRCTHNIIANSSYSWWAAWLNRNPDKSVIAPAQWYADSTMKNPDIYCENWIKV